MPIVPYDVEIQCILCQQADSAQAAHVTKPKEKLGATSGRVLCPLATAICGAGKFESRSRSQKHQEPAIVIFTMKTAVATIMPEERQKNEKFCTIDLVRTSDRDFACPFGAVKVGKRKKEKGL